ncbi:MAG: hypothetical protein ACM3SQ_08095 [Betaproteobacteria bacterium]
MARRFLAAAVVVGVAWAAPARAQLDPLLFMKPTTPNVLLVVDTADRMERDAPTDPADPFDTSNYYDPYIYSRTGALWESELNVNAANTVASYRRKYAGLTYSSNGGDRYAASTIATVGDLSAGFSTFLAPTRLAIARAALYQAVVENMKVARFGLIKMRQSSPTAATKGNSGPVADADPFQLGPTETGSSTGRWNISRPTVSGNNGSTATSGLLVKADSATANSDILTTLSKDPTTAGALLPAGNDDANTQDTPVNNMLLDAKSEAARLIGADAACRNTVVVLVVGGGEGTTSGSPTLSTTASAFLNVASGRRVPIYVIAIAPPSADVASLQSVAAASGGQYFEITKAEIDAALGSSMQASPWVSGTVAVPEMVSAINVAVSHTFASTTDFNTAPTVALPYGPSTEYQVTSPIIGTVDLTNAKDITGGLLTNTAIYDKSGNLIPQRSNVMVTTGLTVPGLTASLRAFRAYIPVADSTQPSGYKFVSQTSPAAEKRLWVASLPTTAGVVDPAKRNLFTCATDGTMIALTTANAPLLAPLMNLSTADATAVIDKFRSLPIGPVVDSTPAIMNPPSLDPPPDADYPAFAVANKDRRTIVWIGTNYGVLEGIDGRLGIEVWGFVPPNLLPKLRTLVDGQPVGTFDYLMDGSPKIADVKIGGAWKTNMIVGEGPGGVFYQSFDVTLPGMGSAAPPDSDNIDLVLNYFASGTAIKVNWAFPGYSDFDPTVNYDPANHKYGDLKASAPAVEKTVGQTWSDPAVGQVGGASAPYTVLVGSGFMPYSTQQLANRGGTVAGTTFYLLSAADGTVYASRDVGSDGVSETVDDCTTQSGGCKTIKNALQSDPVATGPSDSRFISEAYLGDLDGNVWRFDVALDGSNLPTITGATKLYAAGSSQPIFSSMATVNVGGTQQYVFFGTGSDLLPATDSTTIYHLLGVLDNGSTGSKTLDQPLAKTSSLSSDERVTAFPAVAGDIVFFTTTVLKGPTACTPPDANLYAFTFIGGPAYDSTGDNKISNKDTPLVKSIAGKRATAPYIVDQHLVFGTGSDVAIFGDQAAYNNGIGQAGVRILSWREVR